MPIPRTLRHELSQVDEPATPAAYFAGWNRHHLVAVDDVLVFCRKQARSLRRRSAESHLHRRFVIAICLDGAGTIIDDGVPFPLKPGQAHVVFPHSYHSFVELEKKEILWMMLTFETREPHRLAPLRQRTLQLSKIDWADLESLVSNFNRGQDARRCDAVAAAVAGLLARWAMQLRGGDGNPVGAALPSRGHAELWQRMQVQLESLAPEDLRVGPLAAKLGVSERHLRQKFQQEAGLSLGAYLRNYRIRRAIGLLASTRLSLAEISDRCGYRSTSSFHRAFAKATGMKPAEFRT
ncbi:MAG: helix-turn-helix domain-containing protein [Luteolibacter sp.]